MMKTDLKRILSISGEQGLFSYVSQATAGVIAESMLTGRRNCFGIRSRMTSLHDISIYTSEGEIRLQEVFEKMHAYLNDNAAPSQKSSPEELKKFFSEAVPRRGCFLETLRTETQSQTFQILQTFHPDAQHLSGGSVDRQDPFRFCRIVKTSCRGGKGGRIFLCIQEFPVPEGIQSGMNGCAESE